MVGLMAIPKSFTDVRYFIYCYCHTYENIRVCVLLVLLTIWLLIYLRLGLASDFLHDYQQTSSNTDYSLFVCSFCRFPFNFFCFSFVLLALELTRLIKMFLLCPHYFAVIVVVFAAFVASLSFSLQLLGSRSTMKAVGSHRLMGDNVTWTLLLRLGTETTAEKGMTTTAMALLVPVECMRKYAPQATRQSSD